MLALMRTTKLADAQWRRLEPRSPRRALAPPRSTRTARTPAGRFAGPSRFSHTAAPSLGLVGLREPLLVHNLWRQFGYRLEYDVGRSEGFLTGRVVYIRNRYHAHASGLRRQDAVVRILNSGGSGRVSAEAAGSFEKDIRSGLSARHFFRGDSCSEVAIERAKLEDEVNDRAVRRGSNGQRPAFRKAGDCFRSAVYEWQLLSVDRLKALNDLDGDLLRCLG